MHFLPICITCRKRPNKSHIRTALTGGDATISSLRLSRCYSPAEKENKSFVFMFLERNPADWVIHVNPCFIIALQKCMQHIKTDYCHNLIIHILDSCDHVTVTGVQTWALPIKAPSSRIECNGPPTCLKRKWNRNKLGVRSTRCEMMVLILLLSAGAANLNSTKNKSFIVAML